MNEQTRIIGSDYRSAFSADDFLRMMELGAFADMRAELVRGEIEKMMPAEWTHGELNARVSALLFPVVKALGGRIGIDVVIRINETTVRAFDIVVVRPGASPQKVLKGVDVLLGIEIAETTLSRDLGDKKADYAAVGIPHYWVADCNREVVHVFREPVADDYAQVTEVRFNEPLPVPGTDASIIIG